jgi:hypothetical protein
LYVTGSKTCVLTFFLGNKSDEAESGREIGLFSAVFSWSWTSTSCTCSTGLTDSSISFSIGLTSFLDVVGWVVYSKSGGLWPDKW